jgi:hypothetical protein
MGADAVGSVPWRPATGDHLVLDAAELVGVEAGPGDRPNRDVGRPADERGAEIRRQRLENPIGKRSARHVGRTPEAVRLFNIRGQ